jgi:hypothetical protein
MTNLPLLSPRDASEFLARYGISRKPATLNRLRSQGGGPPFRRVGRAVYYEPEALSRWVAERISQPMRSTSDKPSRMTAPGKGSTLADRLAEDLENQLRTTTSRRSSANR